MTFHGLNKLTLLDYPGHMAATLFAGGCNMRCPFCQNSSLVLDPGSQPRIDTGEILRFLGTRKGILEGVCVTGGEPTLQRDLPEFIAKIKAMSFLVKLDTNGTNPAMVKALIQDGLIDYIAMDIKASRANYPKLCGVAGFDVSPVIETTDIIRSSPIDYEFRTTVVGTLHTDEDFVDIGEWLDGSKAIYLQNFEDSGDLICQGLEAAPKETLERYSQILAPHFEKVELRGV
ncbi:MAG: anaerobic ribonucleoside-triphosphate reductase activating protein [Lachnospiraceae bacterium]|nr:anaerobic ribonucleoside-triphosphate reductase activating protein [Lachnospiraceae bacterium]